MLDDLSTVLSQMKEMSMDMNTEIDRYVEAPKSVTYFIGFLQYETDHSHFLITGKRRLLSTSMTTFRN